MRRPGGGMHGGLHIRLARASEPWAVTLTWRSSRGLRMPAAYGLEPQAVSGDAPGIRVLLYLPGSAEGLRWHPLSGIEKPGSGTEPIHQEHVMCSRFRGSCPSDVKSAGHPEPGFSISLSGCSAALCAPREIQKNPAARSVPGYRHGSKP